MSKAAKDFVTLAQDALPTACYEELCVMQVDAFNPDARTIHIERSKSGKGSYIPLSDEGVTSFTTEVKDKKPTDLMFTRKDGRQRLVDRTPGPGFRVVFLLLYNVSEWRTTAEPLRESLLPVSLKAIE